MSVNFPWDLLQSTSVPEIFIVAGFLLCLPSLGIEIRGIRLSERFKTKRALAAGATMALFGVVLEILVFFQTNTELPGTHSEEVADRVTIEERTILPVPDHLSVANTKSDVKTMLEENLADKVHRFIEVWTAVPSSRNPLPKDLIEEIREHLPRPEVNVEPRTPFGGKMIVAGHATLHINRKALEDVLEVTYRGYIQREPSSDVRTSVPETSVGTHGQSDIQTKLPPRE